MKVKIEAYTKQILGLVLNSGRVRLTLPQKDELFSLQPNTESVVSKDTLDALLYALSEMSDDNILWQVDDDETKVYKLQTNGNKWRRDLDTHLSLALALHKLPKLWEKE